MRVLSFERFKRLFADEFELDEGELSRDTRLVTELAFDSFELFRVAIVVEMLAPIDMPENVDIDSLTLGQVYDHYAVNAAVLDSGLED
jgi:acyl carrier protein